MHKRQKIYKRQIDRHEEEDLIRQVEKVILGRHGRLREDDHCWFGPRPRRSVDRHLPNHCVRVSLSLCLYHRSGSWPYNRFFFFLIAQSNHWRRMVHDRKLIATRHRPGVLSDTHWVSGVSLSPEPGAFTESWLKGILPIGQLQGRSEPVAEGSRVVT